eukprot:TRINITY_DN19889_c0_g1_i1.p1 TRINITY_DN19889_c0_g1~~TRINITY_DN19889_c0_g1_i1.p1  ORF type:complete len:321 (+),score=52.26 TRINITY_DN19889_c0_g1_i1:110-964(+)
MGYFVEYCSGGSNYRLREIESPDRCYCGKVIKDDVSIKAGSSCAYRHLERVIGHKVVGNKTYLVCEPLYDLETIKRTHKITDSEDLIWKVLIEVIRGLVYLQTAGFPHHGKLKLSFNDQAEIVLEEWYLNVDGLPLTLASEVASAVDELFPSNLVTRVFDNVPKDVQIEELLRLPQIASRVAFSCYFYDQDLRSKVLDKREASLRKKQVILKRISNCLREFDVMSVDDNNGSLHNRELSFGQSLNTLLTSLNSGGTISQYGEGSSLSSKESEVDPFLIGIIRDY